MALRMMCYSCGERISPSETPNFNPAGNTVHAKCLNKYTSTSTEISISLVDFIFQLHDTNQHKVGVVRIPSDGHFYSVSKDHNAVGIHKIAEGPYSTKVISWEPYTENWAFWDSPNQGARLKLDSGIGSESLKQALSNYGFNV